MEFKIDTKPNYVQITPMEKRLDAKLAEKLVEKQTELSKSGSRNFIIDLSACHEAEKEALPALVHLHADCYSSGQSLVFTGVQDALQRLLKDTETDMAINIAPTHTEATDIINMEILERDLFNEE